MTTAILCFVVGVVSAAIAYFLGMIAGIKRAQRAQHAIDRANVELADSILATANDTLAKLRSPKANR